MISVCVSNANVSHRSFFLVLSFIIHHYWRVFVSYVLKAHPTDFSCVPVKQNFIHRLVNKISSILVIVNKQKKYHTQVFTQYCSVRIITKYYFTLEKNINLTKLCCFYVAQLYETSECQIKNNYLNLKNFYYKFIK